MKRLEGGELLYPNKDICPKNPGNNPCEVSEEINIRREKRRYKVPLRGPACGCIQRRKNLSVSKE